MPKLNKNHGVYLSSDDGKAVTGAVIEQDGALTSALFTVQGEAEARRLLDIIATDLVPSSSIGMFQFGNEWTVMCEGSSSPDALIAAVNTHAAELLSLEESPFRVNISKPDAMQFKGMTGILAQAAIWQDGAKEKSNKKKASAALSLTANIVTSRYGTMKNVDSVATAHCVDEITDMLGVDVESVARFRPDAAPMSHAGEQERSGMLGSVSQVMSQVPELMRDPDESMESLNDFLQKKSTVIDNALKLTGKFLFGLNGLLKGNIPETLLGGISIIAKFVGFSGQAMPDEVREKYPKKRHDVSEASGLKELWGNVDNNMELTNMVEMSRDIGVFKMSRYMANKVQGLMELLANLNFFPAAFQAQDDQGNPRFSWEAMTAGTAIVAGRSAQMLSDTTVKILDVKGIMKFAAEALIRHVPEEQRKEKTVDVVGKLYCAMQDFPRQTNISPMELHHQLRGYMDRAQRKLNEVGEGLAGAMESEADQAVNAQRRQAASESLPSLAGATASAPALTAAHSM